jgi:hypothetical protein
MFALIAALLVLSGQLDRPMWNGHVLATSPGQAWMSATGAGALHLAACGAASTNSAPDKTHAFLIGADGSMDVTPAGFSGAMINDSAGLQHVGGVAVLGNYPGHAWLWTDFGASIDLNPPGFTVSEALGVGGGQQVGYVDSGAFCPQCGLVMQRHAVMWSGTADSMVQLHTKFASYTMATGTDGVQQVGEGAVGIGFHALLWNGPGSAVIDLNPGPAWKFSMACAVDDGHQVGSIAGTATSDAPHAALWTSTAASWVDLNPSGYSQSNACSVHAGVQVGSGAPSAAPWTRRALAWQGSSASVTDLHALLPAEFQAWNSYAEDIDAFGNIVGYVELGSERQPALWLRKELMATAQSGSLGTVALK